MKRKMQKMAKRVAALTATMLLILGTCLPVLAEIEEKLNVLSRVPLGIQQVPLSKVVGTASRGRTSAFAANFMPLLDQASEFSHKWATLYDSIVADGDDNTVATDVRIGMTVQELWEEGVLRHLYDYTWVMEVMNQTDDMPCFNTPASFIAYLKAADVERLPSEDSINKKQNTFTGRFPDWIFVDCDTMEAKRRINVGKRFLNIFQSV